MANSKFTEKQQQVIDFDSGNLVVSASAGSGKTSVMIERIIRLILEKKADISEILAVTFTKLASTEMKDRIGAAILEAIKNGEDRELLKKQLEGLPLASVSTIDSFCTNLLRTYFYAANIDPQFAVADETDSGELRKQAIDTVFEELYEKNDEDLLSLLEIFIAKRSDRKLKEIVESIYKYAVTEKNVDEFLEKSLYYYTEEGVKSADNQLIAVFSGNLTELSRSALDLSEKSKKYSLDKFAEFFLNYSDVVKGIAAANEPQKLIDAFAVKFPSKPRVKEAEKTPIIEEISNEYTKLKEAVDKLKKKITEVFSVSESERVGYALSAGKTAQKLIKIVKLFENEYSALKRENNVLDFADLEHFALQVLDNDALREEISSAYKYIFVDEYQDTNGVQEAIFQKLERNNLFIVGDVKQSIYAFRGCNPNIFKAKIDACASGYGTHIDLDANFRSASGVIEAVNNVFSGVMHQANAGLDYEKSKMTGGSLYGENVGEARVCFFEKSKKTEQLDIGVYGVKKHLNAMNSIKPDGEEVKVLQIIASELGKPFYDVKKKEVRPIEYGDITILTRSNTGIGDRILKELVRHGVPVVSGSKRSIGEYPEIKFMVNLLEFIVNPTRDIPLVAVLKSVIGGLNENELAQIKSFSKADSFYECCLSYIENASGVVKDKLVNFFDYFEKIRLLTQFETVDTVLNTIISERGYDLDILSSSAGEVKAERVNRFILAGAKLTVCEYLSKLDTMLQSLTVSSAGGDNAVKIMSYHASKGLEFPVVILTEISKQFNGNDLKSEVLFDREIGFGLKHYNLQTMTSRNSPVSELIKIKKGYAIAVEEMRLLYVAMTRARYKLFVLCNGEVQAAHRAENYLTANKLQSFICSSDMEELVPSVTADGEELEQRPLILTPSDSQLKKDISEFIDYSYPFECDTNLNLKRTVTEIASEHSSSESEKPILYEERSLFSEDVIAKGVAYHRYLETCDFTKNVDNELIRLHNEEKLTDEQLKLLSKSELEEILSMDVFKLVNGMSLYREQPFILNLPASMTMQTESSENVLVQGVIDLLAVSGKDAYIIDYKFSAKSDEAIKATYAKQLELYAIAVNKISGLNIKGKYIVNLRLKRIIEV